MKYSFSHWQQNILTLLTVALLVFCQRPRDGHEEPCLWRPQADAAILAPLKLLDLPHGAILQKFKPPIIRWNDGTSFIHVTSNMEVAFSNTSFMAFRRCVCIPLRL